jgi:PPOX class probable F420-dependent enzyme
MHTIGLLSDHPPAEIPATHRDLAECPPVAALTTVTPGGYPQTSVVWCDFDGQCLRVNTMRGFAKERNMRRNRRVTLLCYDPRQPLRYLEVRGLVTEMTEAGAASHLDRLASKYAGQPVRFFGDAIPASFAETETPVLCLIQPARVVALDATEPGPRAGAEAEHTTGPIPAGTLPVPPSHLDLLTRPVCGVFTTLGHDGQPQSTLVWVDLDRECALVNTTLERQKGRNLLGNQKVSLLVVDPGNTSRFIQIRGDAELVTANAREHLDALARKYTGHSRYYGYVRPEAQRLCETRVICRIHPRRITLDAIHVADHEVAGPGKG